MNPRRWLWLLLLVPLVAGLMRLRLDTEVLHLLPADLPEVRGLKLWQDHFGSSQDLLITLRTEDAESASQWAKSLADALRSQAGLAKKVYWQAPWREHPGESAEIAAAAWLNSSPREMATLIARLQPDQLRTNLAELRSRLSLSLSPAEIGRLSYDPLQLLDVPALTGNAAQFAEDGPPFASNDGTFRVIHVEPPEVFNDYRAATEWLRRVRQTIGESSDEGDATGPKELRFTGGPVFLSEIASDMEHDMKRSVTGTAIVVALLFLLVHRRFKPLLWLVALLAFVLLATMAFGGAVYGRLNVVSMGFAAILLGLAVDYGLVIYQERLAHGGLLLREVLRATSPGIWWSAITTAGAFALLNFGGLPGLAQLGSLVAAGVMVAAVVMLACFLKPLELTDRKTSANSRLDPDAGAEGLHPAPRVNSLTGWVVPTLTLIIGLLALVAVILRPPTVDATAGPLRPALSPAYEAMDELRKEIGGTETWALLVTGSSEQVVADRLRGVESRLEQLTKVGDIDSVVMPGALWPNPRNQSTNREPIQSLVGKWESIVEAARDAGFTAESLALANGVVGTWRRALSDPEVFWPGNEVSRWILREMTARDGRRFIAAGAIKPGKRKEDRSIDELQTGGVLIAGWERLGPALLGEVETRLKWVLAGIVAVVVLTLSLTFRNPVEVGLSIACLLFSGLLLLGAMSLAGWSWNLMNLMAVPLLLGATVDYSIHMQLSLRRHGGDVRAAFGATGKALLLCAATTAAGFGSLAFSSNAGLASLGKVCGVGAGCAAWTACFLLPRWWHLGGAMGRHRGPLDSVGGPTEPEGRLVRMNPSRLYGVAAWRLGLKIVCLLPVGVSRRLGWFLSVIYGRIARSRKHVVRENLLPVFNGNQVAARRAAERLFGNFGIKIADLLRYEGGRAVDHLFHNLPSAGQFSLTATPGRGTLLLTIHLGNWEFGAPLLRRIGVNLLVITLAEPGRGFTELREAARKRWGVETLVIGQDAFAFVEVLKRLQDGAVIALLLDRPPAASSVTVELFGRPFSASVSATELARASGCALIPVAIPWTPAGYEVISLPEIVYDRAELNNREARRQLTQEIVRAFEPVIRQHPDQWFHFVPVWK